MIKAIRIGEDLDSFLNERPEIKIFKRDEKITCICIPQDAILNFLLIHEGILYELEYIYNDELNHFAQE